FAFENSATKTISIWLSFTREAILLTSSVARKECSDPSTAKCIFLYMLKTPSVGFMLLVERFKSSFRFSYSYLVLLKDVASKDSLRLPQLEYTRFPRASGKPPRASTKGSYLSLTSRRSLAYSICWGKFSISAIHLIRFI